MNAWTASKLKSLFKSIQSTNSKTRTTKTDPGSRSWSLQGYQQHLSSAHTMHPPSWIFSIPYRYNMFLVEIYFINCVYTTRKKIIFEFIIVYIVSCMHIALIHEDKCCWVGTHALSGSRFGSRISFCGTGVSVQKSIGWLSFKWSQFFNRRLYNKC